MPRPFTEFLAQQRNGETANELADKLAELVSAVKACRQKGSLTFTVSVKPLEADSAQVVVTDDITVKLPKKARGGSVFFATDENSLTRKDPRQNELPLRSVDAPASVFKEVQPEGGSNGTVG